MGKILIKNMMKGKGTREIVLNGIKEKQIIDFKMEQKRKRGQKKSIKEKGITGPRLFHATLDAMNFHE